MMRIAATVAAALLLVSCSEEGENLNSSGNSPRGNGSSQVEITEAIATYACEPLGDLPCALGFSGDDAFYWTSIHWLQSGERVPILRLIDREDPKITELPPPFSSSGTLVFSQDGGVLLFGAREQLHVCDIPEKLIRFSFALEDQVEKIGLLDSFHPSFSADGSHIVYSSTSDRLTTVVSLDAQTGEVRSKVTTPFVGRQSGVSESGDRVLIVGEERRGGVREKGMLLWDVDSNSDPKAYFEDDEVHFCDLSPAGSVIAAMVGDNKVSLVLLDVDNGETLHEIDTKTSGDLVFSPDGKWIALVGLKNVRFFNRSTGKENKEAQIDLGWRKERLFWYSPGSQYVAAVFKDEAGTNIGIWKAPK